MPPKAQHAFPFGPDAPGNGADGPNDDDTALDDGSFGWTPGEIPPFLPLNLILRDPAVIAALLAQPEGRRRDEFAADALRIGVAALRHASSRLDAEQLGAASEKLLAQLKDALTAHADHSNQQTAAVLKEYFDPKSGRLAERVERLVSADGELATLLRTQLHGDGSPLARLLATQLGRDSPLMRQLDPDQSTGLFARLQKTVDEQLRSQRDHVLREFSLDNPQSALKRLVDELTCRHGDLQKGLGDKIDNVVKEFSLDKEDSALSRLVRNVDRAQRTITSEFSLDNDESGLSRLKRELLTILGAHVESNAKFQEEVSVALGRLVQKRESAAVSPEHGHEFEGAVLAFLATQADQRGDLCEVTGATTGLVKNCKVGDAVLRLGPETPAPGARIVFEAKEARGYTPANAIDELETARKNRGADFGVFVWSRQTAPESAKPLARFGQDLLVIWDAEDQSTDPYLLAAIEIARACVVEQHRGDAREDIDVEAIDRAINAIEKSAQSLDKIRVPAESIKSSSEKILDRVRIEQTELERQVATLRQKLVGLRGAEG
ncbi:hypothetical protein [Botrimarina mediterranea]|uniref:Uncharacterized protein n=1 Tax=Botrimarina mediterranea TaxID=2528022 RepID=A0A518K3D8_9BACT|nr:hypothetical protein [Botrimarina mediterranea]QDV72297.1 hypothetical protein Spa11_04710 [Botrimarina mediterranea]QDV76841.1 hypothetical protein K2D_04240 [Planctomycetes bacterium K2D]